MAAKFKDKRTSITTFQSTFQTRLLSHWSLPLKGTVRGISYVHNQTKRRQFSEPVHEDDEDCSIIRCSFFFRQTSSYICYIEREIMVNNSSCLGRRKCGYANCDNTSTVCRIEKKGDSENQSIDCTARELRYQHRSMKP